MLGLRPSTLDGNAGPCWPFPTAFPVPLCRQFRRHRRRDPGRQNRYWRRPSRRFANFQPSGGAPVRRLYTIIAPIRRRRPAPPVPPHKRRRRFRGSGHYLRIGKTTTDIVSRNRARACKRTRNTRRFQVERVSRQLTIRARVYSSLLYTRKPIPGTFV